MRLIPDKPFDTNSYGERLVFDALRECFINDNQFVAFHSYNLTRHDKQSFEIQCKDNTACYSDIIAVTTPSDPN